MRTLWAGLLLAPALWRSAKALKGGYVDNLDDTDVDDPQAEHMQGLRVDSRGHFVQEHKAAHFDPSSEEHDGGAPARRPQAAENESADGGSHPSSLVTTDDAKRDSHKKAKKNAITWYCDGYCLRCSNGIEWRVTRAQPIGRKIAKWFGFGIIAVAMTMVGPFMGFFGYLYLGAFALIPGGTMLVLAGGGIGLAHLMVGMHERACPVVGFEEKIQKNRGFLMGMTADLRDAFKKVPDEAKFSLNDLNFQELLLRLEHSNGTKVIKGDRADIPSKERIESALACNVLTLHSKYWNDDKEHPKKPEAVIEAIVGGCGKWLCAKQKVTKQWKMGWFVGAGCGGFRGSIGNWFR